MSSIVLYWGLELQLRLQYCCYGTFHNDIVAAIAAVLAVFSRIFLAIAM